MIFLVSYMNWSVCEVKLLHWHLDNILCSIMWWNTVADDTIWNGIFSGTWL